MNLASTSILIKLVSVYKDIVFNSKKSEGQITLKGRKEGSIYQRKRDRERRKEGRKGERENA